MRRLLFWNFRIVHRWSDWMRRRFSVAGRMVLTLTLIVAALGMDTRQTPLHHGAALLMALLVVAMLSALTFRCRVQARRHLPRYATVNVPFAYQVTVHNQEQRHQRHLLLRDEFKARYLSGEQLARLFRAEPDHRNWFDRRVGYPRWANMIRRHTGAYSPETVIEDLPAAGSVRTSLTMTPLRRGLLRFSGLAIGRTDPLGLHRSFHYLPCADTLTVLPRQYPVSLHRLRGRRSHQRGDMARADSVGDAQEFTTVREYQPGDSPRHIHWPGTARTGTPIVKQFQDEYLVRHAVALDTCTDLACSQGFEAAVSVAASFVSAEREPDTLLDLLFVADDVHQVSSGRGGHAVDQLLQLLAAVEPIEPARFDAFRHALLSATASISQLILVLPCWDTKREQLVAELRSNGVSLHVFLIRTATQAPPADADLTLVAPDAVATSLAAFSTVRPHAR